MVVLNFDFRNRGHLVHPFQSYGRIYFNIFQQKWFPLVYYKEYQKQKLFREGFALDFVWPLVGMGRNPGSARKKCLLHKKAFFRDVGSLSVILVNKPLKALCLSSKMVYQQLLYLLSLWTY